MSVRGHQNLYFDPFSFGGRVRKRRSMFAWTVIPVVADVVWLQFHKSNCTININLIVKNIHGC